MLEALCLLLGLCLGAIGGAVVWERLRVSWLTRGDAQAERDRAALVEELRGTRDAAVERANLAERRMRDVEQMLLEARAHDAGVTVPPAPAEATIPPLPVELVAELNAIDDPEARAEFETLARTMIEAGKPTSQVIDELWP